MPRQKKNHLDEPRYYINRELSWLEFNRRVLLQAQKPELPLLERLKFLAIFCGNLDEFFMIRVAGLMQQAAAGVRKHDKSGMTPRQQLEQIGRRTHVLAEEHSRTLKDVLGELRKHGLYLLGRDEWTLEQKRFLKNYFHQEVLPVLTPLALRELEPCPLLPGLQMQVALTVEPDPSDGDEPPAPKLLVIPVPGMFVRFLTIPSTEQTLLVTLEDVIAENAAALCEGRNVLSADFFRLTRDADVGIQEDEAGDLLETMEAALTERQRRRAVRLEVSAGASPSLVEWLKQEYRLKDSDVYAVHGLLNGGSLWEIVGRSGFEALKIPDWPPLPPQDLIGYDSVWEAVSDHDVMLFHPYESFDPVVRLVEEAAEDPGVLAIKQTLYRTSGDSPIIDALERAAENGKEVTVLVELRARFDESRNIRWARRLEDAGCHVIYGVVGLKTHAKALMIVRREEGRIRRYVHLATGNYNDKTVRLYSDVGLMSCDPNLGMDVASFFNLLTGFSEAVGWNELTIAPTAMRTRFYELIDREIKASTPDRPGLIMAKVNSLEDEGISRALYEASRAGVRILLNIRGICCLRPHVKGVSEHIEVVSILDRFLEHARIFYFGNGGHPELYLGSADWMRRNLDKRLELLFPVQEPALKARLTEILNICFADNVQAYELQSDGSYRPRVTDGPRTRAQEHFYEQAAARLRQSRQSPLRFVPIRQPKKE